MKFIITDNTGMCFHESKHMLIRHVMHAIRVQLFNVIRIEISLRQMIPDDSLNWHDNGSNERIAFIIIHWINRADNIELIAAFWRANRLLLASVSLRMLDSRCVS